MKKLLLLLSIILALFLIFMGVQKFLGANPVFSYLGETTGFALFEPVIRILTGVMEIIAALLLLWPAKRKYGALLAAAIIGGALVFHLSPFLGINAPVTFTPDGSYVKSSMLFFMAVGSFIVALAVISVDRKSRE
ncbi:MAG: DoxX family protein [Robiginitomaculum sp.]|nr:DoxX family protein [Robiginitomaculum sp.]